MKRADGVVTGIIIAAFSLVMFALFMSSFFSWCTDGDSSLCKVLLKIGFDRPDKYATNSLNRLIRDINNGHSSSIVHIDGFTLEFVPKCKEDQTPTGNRCKSKPNVCLKSTDKLYCKDLESWNFKEDVKPLEDLYGQCSIILTYEGGFVNPVAGECSNDYR